MLSRLSCVRGGIARSFTFSRQSVARLSSTPLLFKFATRRDDDDNSPRPAPLPLSIPSTEPSSPTAPPSSSPSSALPLMLTSLTGLSALHCSAALAEGAGMAIPSTLATVLKVAPPACFFFLQISGLKTVRQIQRNKTTGDLSVLPFLSLATNCVVWSLYGALLSDLTVLIPNLSGALLGIYYTSVYAKYSPKSLLLPLTIGGTIVGAVGGLALTQGVAAAPLIGYTGCALAVVLMASPLATISTVVRDRSTAAMPFVTSVATFFNASAWFGYGALVAGDPIIWGPNALGLGAAVVQLALFAKYGIARQQGGED